MTPPHLQTLLDVVEQIATVIIIIVGKRGSRRKDNLHPATVSLRVPNHPPMAPARSSGCIASSREAGPPARLNTPRTLPIIYLHGLNLKTWPTIRQWSPFQGQARSNTPKTHTKRPYRYAQVKTILWRMGVPVLSWELYLLHKTKMRKAFETLALYHTQARRVWRGKRKLDAQRLLILYGIYTFFCRSFQIMDCWDQLQVWNVLGLGNSIAKMSSIVRCRYGYG